MNSKHKHFERLARISKGLGFLTFSICFFRILNISFLSNKLLIQLELEELKYLPQYVHFTKTMSLGFLLLFISSVIESSFCEKKDSKEKRYLNMVNFFLGLQCGLEIITAVIENISTKNLIHEDLLFKFQLIFFQSLDMLNAIIPALLGYFLYQIYTNYRRLEVFEKEVI